MKRIYWLAAALALLLVIGAGVVRWNVLRVLRGSAEEFASEQDLKFDVHGLTPSADPGFEWISAPAVFSHAIQFQGHLHVCGPAGLFEFDSRGTLLKQYRVGRELPSAPLTYMTIGVLPDGNAPELIVATDGEGLLTFDGSAFRQIRPQNSDARNVTAVLPLNSGQLLLGTAKHGLLVYDGKRLGYFHPTLKNIHITALAGNGSDLWVGTMQGGLLHYHAGQTDVIAEGQGLPDSHVNVLAVQGDRVFAGTPVGVAALESGRVTRVLGAGVFATALKPTDTMLLVGSMDQGLLQIPLNTGRLASPRKPASADLEAVQQVFESDGVLYALTRDSLFQQSKQTLGWRRVLSRDAALLSDRNVSALAIDRMGRVWVGYFDRGLDILDSNGRQARHVEDGHVFCVNRVLADEKRGTVAVATANGLVLFDVNGNKQQVLTKRDGLISDHVTDVVLYRGGMGIATPAGLTFVDDGGARSLYAFHGLVNNHVYALGVNGQRLLAGTLGGISMLDNENISANYTTANSGLKHNWITAVVPVGDEWFFGTYGAGVLRMDAGGQFEPFETATGPFEINPNAMLVTSTHVFAGTLGRGLYVFDRGSQRWTVVTAGLPSLSVTALTAGNGYVYIGTDNGLVRIAEQSLR